jgi:hypothetical protein
MWFSWRPRGSIALAESEDGRARGRPVVVLGPNKTSGWEDEVNRPAVLKKGGLYRMWYTGQAKGKSRIGHATSRDGKAWRRLGERPVLSPERPWEKVAVMCPHVLYYDKAGLYRMWYSGGGSGCSGTTDGRVTGSRSGWPPTRGRSWASEPQRESPRTSREDEVLPLHEDPCFTFRFADGRLIPRFHLEGIVPGSRVSVFKVDPGTGERLGLLAQATVGAGGWVDLTVPIVVRAGDVFIAVPEPRPGA